MAAGFLSIAAFGSTSVRAANPAASFNEAIRLDVGGEAKLAFESYLRAANAGMPEAEFNVAVMLDSGRGTQMDSTQAATWYARAAAHGNERAAYNLGQLYESGQGVPQNDDLARAWFMASGLPAGRSRLTVHVSGTATKLTAPTPVSPGEDADLSREVGGIEFVWTSGRQPEPIRYYIEVRSIGIAGSKEVFSSLVATSSVFANWPALAGAYAWRVMSIAAKAGIYAASDWHGFTVSAVPGPVKGSALNGR